MSCTSTRERMIMKQSTVSGTKPTIPASDNHQDGSWLTTDIYKGEIFFNVADGIMWTRADIDGTDTIITIDGYTDIYAAVLNQASTAAPIAYNAKYSFSSAIVWTRSSAGVYIGTLSNAFPSNRTVVLFPDLGQGTQTVHYEWLTASTISLKSFTAGAGADDIISKLGIFIGILPEQTPAS